MRIGRLGIVTALTWVATTAAIAGPQEDTSEAARAYATGDVVAAMKLYTRAADAGDALAQVRLAEILDAAEDDQRAVDYFRRAAAQNHPAGEFGLGRMYAKGEGVARDPAEALRWYRRAADRDHLPAIEAIAWAYATGDLGLPKDKAEADAWGARAVKLGGTAPVMTAKGSHK